MFKILPKKVFSSTVILKIPAGAAAVIKLASVTNNMRYVPYENAGEL